MIKNALAVCAAILFGCAAVSAQQANEPKLYKVGNVEVWAIADSIGERNLDIFEGVDDKILKKYVPNGKAPSAVMTYLIKDGQETIIIDTGYGKGLMSGLEKLKVKPEDITTILITHMHGDHIGGLVKDGQAVFSNAVVKIGKQEYDFWTDEKSVEKFPGRKANFDMVKNAVTVCNGSIEVFGFEDMAASNIKALDASGHTPGQAAFLLEAGGEKLLFIADMIHVQALQFARPDISSRYDMDPEKAAQTRKKYLKFASESKIPVAGAHIAYPGIGTVKKDGKTGFAFKSERKTK